jgi:hypothetical protein
MTTAYYSTKDLCDRFRISPRTVSRRMLRKVNPFPQPCIQFHGAKNLWDRGEIDAWEAAERERTRLRLNVRNTLGSERSSSPLPGACRYNWKTDTPEVRDDPSPRELRAIPIGDRAVTGGVPEQALQILRRYACLLEQILHGVTEAVEHLARIDDAHIANIAAEEFAEGTAQLPCQSFTSVGKNTVCPCVRSHSR